MSTDYQIKYVESIKLYNRLHSEVTDLITKLTVHRFDSENKQFMFDSINDFLAKTKDIDNSFCELIRVKQQEKQNLDISV